MHLPRHRSGGLSRKERGFPPFRNYDRGIDVSRGRKGSRIIASLRRVRNAPVGSRHVCGNSTPTPRLFPKGRSGRHIMSPGNRESRGPAAWNRKSRESEGEGGLDDMWWVYMIECRGGKIYTGIAKDPEARYRRHLAGTGAAFTRMNPPLSMLAKWPCGTRTDALKAERALRRLPGKAKRAWAREAPDRPSPRLPVSREKKGNSADSVHPGRTRPGGGKSP